MAGLTLVAAGRQTVSTQRQRSLPGRPRPGTLAPDVASGQYAGCVSRSSTPATVFIRGDSPSARSPKEGSLAALAPAALVRRRRWIRIRRHGPLVCEEAFED